MHVRIDTDTSFGTRCHVEGLDVYEWLPLSSAAERSRLVEAMELFQLAIWVYKEGRPDDAQRA